MTSTLHAGASGAALRHAPARAPTRKTGKVYLVIDGHGMLGSHIVEALLARGEERIRVLDLVPSILFQDEERRGAVTFHCGDLRNRELLRATDRDGV